MFMYKLFSQALDYWIFMYILFSRAVTYWMFMYILFSRAVTYWMSMYTLFSRVITYWMSMYMLFSRAVTYWMFMYTLFSCAVTILRPITQRIINKRITGKAVPDSVNGGQFLCWPNNQHFASKKSAQCSSSQSDHLICFILFQIPISALKSVNELLNSKNQGQKPPVNH